MTVTDSTIVELQVEDVNALKIGDTVLLIEDGETSEIGYFSRKDDKGIYIDHSVACNDYENHGHFTKIVTTHFGWQKLYSIAI